MLTRYPAAERNKGPILEVLKRVFTKESSVNSVLEIGSASGQHVAHFAPSFPHIRFQPSDVDSSLFTNINNFRSHYSLLNVSIPIILDLSSPLEHWPIPQHSYDAIYCSNVLHISPWACSVGLFRGAARVLKPAGLLVVYGPFAVDGSITPESNVQFDLSLRSRDPEWGIRDLRNLKKLANENGLQFQEMIDMPANNKILLFKKGA